jgi:hypothetical protein
MHGATAHIIDCPVVVGVCQSLRLNTLLALLGHRAMSALAPLLGDKQTLRIYEYTP